MGMTAIVHRILETGKVAVLTTGASAFFGASVKTVINAGQKQKGAVEEMSKAWEVV
jgi:hypothetical protein